MKNITTTIKESANKPSYKTLNVIAKAVADILSSTDEKEAYQRFQVLFEDVNFNKLNDDAFNDVYDACMDDKNLGITFQNALIDALEKIDKQR